MYRLGCLVGTHGLRGELKLRCDYPEIDFKNIKRVVINDSSFDVISYRPHKDNMLITLQAINSIDLAEKYKNAIVYIEEDLASKLDLVFSEEVIDKKVFNLDNTPVGTVNNIMQTPAHDILVIDSNGKELLVPWVDKYVIKIAEDIHVDLTDLAIYGE